MRTIRFVLLAASSLALAAPALAQPGVPAPRNLEFGIDAGAVFGLGDQSSVNVNLPGSRFRVGFFQPGSRWSIEPALGLGYNKVEGKDGQFRYDVELGTLYHFAPIMVAGGEPGADSARVLPPYLRPFVGFTGFSGGEEDENEFSAGVGLGTKIPWRRDLAIRLELNVGYGFDNEAARIGLLAGLSFFPR